MAKKGKKGKTKRMVQVPPQQPQLPRFPQVILIDKGNGVDIRTDLTINGTVGLLHQALEMLRPERVQMQAQVAPTPAPQPTTPGS